MLSEQVHTYVYGIKGEQNQKFFIDGILNEYITTF